MATASTLISHSAITSAIKERPTCGELLEGSTWTFFTELIGVYNRFIAISSQALGQRGQEFGGSTKWCWVATHHSICSKNGCGTESSAASTTPCIHTAKCCWLCRRNRDTSEGLEEIRRYERQRPTTEESYLLLLWQSWTTWFSLSCVHVAVLTFAKSVLSEGERIFRERIFGEGRSLPQRKGRGIKCWKSQADWTTSVLWTVNSNTCRVKIDGRGVPMEVDTGVAISLVNLVSKSTFKNEPAENASLQV